MSLSSVLVGCDVFALHVQCVDQVCSHAECEKQQITEIPLSVSVSASVCLFLSIYVVSTCVCASLCVCACVCACRCVSG